MGTPARSIPGSSCQAAALHFQGWLPVTTPISVASIPSCTESLPSQTRSSPPSSRTRRSYREKNEMCEKGERGATGDTRADRCSDQSRWSSTSRSSRMPRAIHEKRTTIHVPSGLARNPARRVGCGPLPRTIHEYLLRRPILSLGEAFLVRPPRRTERSPTSALLARSPGVLRSRTPRDDIHE